eukprot:TRINITY_DN1050_c0_g1_i1.p1 TRINITY_DN1050_c0_g1~~TRINITY_DN1050_c0_g1_i1.p1  ORF type:complete len:176 (+),score=33.39 TRINITY_DN1050_c0_g1_i1:116-643(+)
MSSLDLFLASNKGDKFDKTVAKLKEIIDSIEEKIDYLNQRIDEEKDQAVNNSKNNKNAAKLNVKRKIFYEKQMEKLYNDSMKLDHILMILDSQTNLEIYEALQSSYRTQYCVNNDITLEIEEIIIKYEDGYEIQEFIPDIQFDEDEIEDLEELIVQIEDDFFDTVFPSLPIIQNT